MNRRLAVAGASLFLLGIAAGVLFTFAWQAWVGQRNLVSTKPLLNDLLGEPEELLVPIEDMFSIKDRGYVATGRVISGPISVGERVWVPTATNDLFFTIKAIESISGTLEQADRGEQVGLLLTGPGGEELQRGHVIRRVPKG